VAQHTELIRSPWYQQAAGHGYHFVARDPVLPAMEQRALDELAAIYKKVNLHETAHEIRTYGQVVTPALGLGCDLLRFCEPPGKPNHRPYWITARILGYPQVFALAGTLNCLKRTTNGT
jgi:hypothetical protein